MYADLSFRVIEFGQTVEGDTTLKYQKTISDHHFSLAGARAALLESRQRVHGSSGPGRAWARRQVRVCMDGTEIVRKPFGGHDNDGEPVLVNKNDIPAEGDFPPWKLGELARIHRETAVRSRGGA
jgi:hypothetical protein